MYQAWAARGEIPLRPDGRLLVQLSPKATVKAYKKLDGVPEQLITNAIISTKASHAKAFKKAFERADRGAYKAKGSSAAVKGNST